MTQSAQSSTSAPSQASIATSAKPSLALNVATPQQLFKEVCAQCHQKEATFRCGSCTIVWYCGKECQKAAWATHKAACFSFSGLGVTREDFNRLIAPLPKDSEVVCEFIDREGHVTPLTQKAFQEKTGASFAPYFHASANAFRHWKELASSDVDTGAIPPSMLPDQQAIERFEKSPPELVLKEEPLFGGFGVAVKKAVKKGEIISLYTGEITPKNQPKSFKSTLYTMRTVDGSATTGLAAFINDGPPNCWLTPLQDYKGIRQVPAVIATRDLREGETLWTPYGLEHPLHYAGYRVDPNKYQELSRYCKSARFYNKPSDLEEMANFFYTITTLSLFLRLLLDGSLNILKAEEIVNKFPKSSDEGAKKLVQDLNDLIQLAKHVLSFGNPLLNQAVIDALLTGVRLSSLIEMLDVLKTDQKLTVERVRDYRTLAELGDQTYLLVHRTLIGSYIGKTDPMPPFDTTQIKTLFPQLPSHLKRIYLKSLSDSHQMSVQRGWTHAADLLQTLLTDFKPIAMALFKETMRDRLQTAPS